MTMSLHDWQGAAGHWQPCCLRADQEPPQLFLLRFFFILAESCFFCFYFSTYFHNSKRSNFLRIFGIFRSGLSHQPLRLRSRLCRPIRRPRWIFFLLVESCFSFFLYFSTYFHNSKLCNFLRTFANFRSGLSHRPLRRPLCRPILRPRWLQCHIFADVLERRK